MLPLFGKPLFKTAVIHVSGAVIHVSGAVIHVSGDDPDRIWRAGFQATHVRANHVTCLGGVGSHAALASVTLAVNVTCPWALAVTPLASVELAVTSLASVALAVTSLASVALAVTSLASVALAVTSLASVALAVGGT